MTTGTLKKIDDVLVPGVRGLRALLEEQPESVIDTLDPADTMYTGDSMHYRRVGLSALKCVRLALLAAGKDEVSHLLDCPCGFGRVLRVFKAAFPAARLAACDLDRQAVDFCARVFGATPYYSNADPQRIELADRFDLIWCGSLLTHLPKDKFVGFIRVFESLLQPGGVLVFTIHGRRPAEWIQTGRRTYGLDASVLPTLIHSWCQDGFGYTEYPGQVDYGMTLSSPAWACAQLQQFDRLRIVLYSEAAWDDHQDVVACIRL